MKSIRCDAKENEEGGQRHPRQAMLLKLKTRIQLQQPQLRRRSFVPNEAGAENFDELKKLSFDTDDKLEIPPQRNAS